MSERAPQPGQPEAREPSDEELKNGFELEPNETVVFEVKPSPPYKTHYFDIGNGVIISGQAIAGLHFGNEEAHATGLVINTTAASGKVQNVLVVSSPSDNKKFIASLKKGQMWGIGREFEDQDMLPKTVSRDHCAVGLDEIGRLVIENHNPTNLTGAQRFA